MIMISQDALIMQIHGVNLVKINYLSVLEVTKVVTSEMSTKLRELLVLGICYKVKKVVLTWRQILMVVVNGVPAKII